MHFATGYFNPVRAYLDLILSSKSSTDVLMAHPEANGFFRAKGVAGGIPPAYTLIAKQFFDLVARGGRSDGVRMFEYIRKGWTFHAKGLWFTPEGESEPSVTMIGEQILLLCFGRETP